MLRIAVVAILLLVSGKGAVFAQDLRTAVSAAMGEAMADSRYPQLLAKYGLPMPDISGNPVLASPARNAYPERQGGTLLNHVLDRGKIRIGWIRVGVPFSFVGKDGKLQGLAVDLWPLILEKLSTKYGTKVEPVWVEFTSQTGNNEMYRQLASDQDFVCATRGLGSPDMCYDIIGGAYAFNEPRKKVSALTAAYYALNMSVVRTPVPLKDWDGKKTPLDTPEAILAAARNPDAGLTFAVLADTGESEFLDTLKTRFGSETFKTVIRPANSNLLEFAQKTEAHFVLGTNVRIGYTRVQTPQFCVNCGVVADLLKFDGVGFATALAGK